MQKVSSWWAVRVGMVLALGFSVSACPQRRASLHQESGETTASAATPLEQDRKLSGTRSQAVAAVASAFGSANRVSAGAATSSGSVRQVVAVAGGSSGPPSDEFPRTVSMLLPQPVAEPALDDGTFDLPEVSLPAGVEILLGSQVVRSTQDSGRRGTLVNVWATWCGSCEAEIPMLVGVQQRYEHRGIAFVFVSVDEPASARDVQRALERYGVSGPAWMAHPELGYFKLALSPIWKGALPASFLYDNSGRLRYFWGAQAFEREVTPVLDAFLDGKPIDGYADLRVRVPARD
ncbi:TlpA disulfide reductase family protein [Myxococcota bacterium]